MSATSLLRSLGRRIGHTRSGRRSQDSEPSDPGSLLPGDVSPLLADAARLAGFLRDYPCWSVFWDKKHAVWRTAEDDLGSDLYAEGMDVDAVMNYITAHT
jgi:hypothetical protein